MPIANWTVIWHEASACASAEGSGCFSDCPTTPSLPASSCHKARPCLCQQATGKKRTLCYLKRPDENVLSVLDKDSVLVIDDLHRHRQWFQDLKAVVKFDLYDLGIAFFNPKYNEQYYIVNF